MILAVVTLFAVHSGPRPVCNKALDGCFEQWMMENHTNTYPNAGGIGSNSLVMLGTDFPAFVQDYGYIPGLRSDDSKGLVLMYLKIKTHYHWHGDAEHTIFSPLLWMVISPDIADSEEPDYPEGGQLVDTAEFKRRIEKTVAFLKANQRPNWQVVAKEQEDFLKSIKE